MKLSVERYSGNKADERPAHFFLDEQVRTVEEIVDHWNGPDDVFFEIRADDGNLYVLHETAGSLEPLLDAIALRPDLAFESGRALANCTRPLVEPPGPTFG